METECEVKCEIDVYKELVKHLLDENKFLRSEIVEQRKFFEKITSKTPIPEDCTISEAVTPAQKSDDTPGFLRSAYETPTHADQNREWTVVDDIHRRAQTKPTNNSWSPDLTNRFTGLSVEIGKDEFVECDATHSREAGTVQTI